MVRISCRQHAQQPGAGLSDATVYHGRDLDNLLLLIPDEPVKPFAEDRVSCNDEHRDFKDAPTLSKPISKSLSWEAISFYKLLANTGFSSRGTTLLPSRRSLQLWISNYAVSNLRARRLSA